MRDGRGKPDALFAVRTSLTADQVIDCWGGGAVKPDALLAVRTTLTADPVLITLFETASFWVVCKSNDKALTCDQLQ